MFQEDYKSMPTVSDRKTELAYLKGHIQYGRIVHILVAHAVVHRVVQSDHAVPGADQQELAGCGSELHRRDHIVGNVVQLNLSFSVHFIVRWWT